MSVTNNRPAGSTLKAVDPMWAQVQREAEDIVRSEPAMASFVFGTVLNYDRLENAVVDRIAQRLDNHVISAEVIRCGFEQALDEDDSLGTYIRSDIAAVYDRDPACSRYIEPLLYFKGFHAIQAHRLANFMHKKGRKDFAYYLQSRSSEVFQTDINPAVPIGRGVFFDHATGLVIGETAVIGDNVSLLHHVTLGGSGTGTGVRHPTIGNGVLIGAGASVLGPVVLGANSKVGAGSVVVTDLPSHCVAVGVPARVVKRLDDSNVPSKDMDQIYDLVLEYII